MPTSRQDKQRLLERIGETGEGHHCIRTRAGSVYEGWIVKVTPKTLTFMHAPSPFYAQATGTAEVAPPDEEVALDDVDACMDERGRWIEF